MAGISFELLKAIKGTFYHPGFEFRASLKGLIQRFGDVHPGVDLQEGGESSLENKRKFMGK